MESPALLLAAQSFFDELSHHNHLLRSNAYVAESRLSIEKGAINIRECKECVALAQQATDLPHACRTVTGKLLYCMTHSIGDEVRLSGHLDSVGAAVPRAAARSKRAAPRAPKL